MIFQDSNLKKVDVETQKVFQELSQNKDRDTSIYEPNAPLLSRIRGRFRKQIILKLTKDNQEIAGEVRKILNFLPAGWIIDVDPISIV